MKTKVHIYNTKDEKSSINFFSASYEQTVNMIYEKTLECRAEVRYWSTPSM